MTRTTLVLALAGALSASALVAQPPAGAPPAGQQPPAAGPRPRRVPGGPMGPGMMGPEMMGPGMRDGMMMRPMGGPNGAELLLAHTGELKLTDAQVVKLAAIARRSADRRETMRKTMRARFDSLRAANPPGAPGQGVRRQMPPQFAADAEKMRDQARADLRDAIAILTPDQQAQAWEMNARRGMGGRRR